MRNNRVACEASGIGRPSQASPKRGISSFDLDENARIGLRTRHSFVYEPFSAKDGSIERVDKPSERLDMASERPDKHLNSLTKRLNGLTKHLNLTKRLNRLTKRLNSLTKRLNGLSESPAPGYETFE